MLDIITIGAGTRDVFLISKNFEIINSAQSATGKFECIPFGSKIDIEKIVHTTGGGATNAAATFAQLGFRTAAICRIGEDNAGSDVLHELQMNGVKTHLVKTIEKGATAYSTLLTTISGERSVLVYRGVSSTFSNNDIAWSKCNANWIYLTSLGGNLAVAKNIIAHAKKKKISLAWNPGGAEIKKGLSVFKNILNDVNILNVNREEAEILAGTGTIKQMLKKLACKGNIVIITDGPKGAYAHLDGITYYAKTSGAKSVSRTGAGDAFGSGFVASWMQTHDIERALAVAMLNAESVIQSIGAKIGILNQFPSNTQLKKIKIKKI
ncbi:MAG: carbohydrate kinase family protein [Patescibacteria group bacterium]